MIDFIKENEFDTSKYQTEVDLTKYIAKQYKMFKELEEVKQMNVKLTKTFEKFKLKPQEVTYTAKFHFFTRVIKPNKKDTRTLAEKLEIIRTLYPKYPIVFDNLGGIYIQRYLARYNTNNSKIVDFANKDQGRTYDYEKTDYDTLWDLITNVDEAMIRDDSYINLIIISNLQAPIIIKDPKQHKPKDELIWNSDIEGGMYHAYINYNINNEARAVFD